MLLKASLSWGINRFLCMLVQKQKIRDPNYSAPNRFELSVRHGGSIDECPYPGRSPVGVEAFQIFVAALGGTTLILNAET
jgi:hypothetical protein